MLIEDLKNEIKKAMKSKDLIRRDILRILVSDSETQAIRQKKQVTDELVHSTVKKIIRGIDDTIDALTKKLLAEKSILEEYIPKVLNKDKIKSFLICKSLVEPIIAAKNDGMATGIAMKSFKKENLPVSGKDVQNVIKEIRIEATK